MKSLSRNFTLVLCGSLLLAAAAHSQVLPAADPSGQNALAAEAAPQPSDQVLQLVAPIALYPDALVGQILTAATYPTQIVEASRWLQQQPALKGNALADAVNSQPWDPSVKAIIQFPAVLDNMDKNLSWTSALGDAYVNEPDDVTNAVQILRQRAQAAGTLMTNSQQTVTTQDEAIDVEPTDPDVVYVPAYDPWLVYGAPLVAYPDWFDVPGVFYDGPDLFFDAGLDLGLFGGFAWGWHHWGFDWHHHAALHDHSPYFSHSPTFAHRHDMLAGRPAFGDHAPTRGRQGSLAHAGGFRGSPPAASFTSRPQFHAESTFRPGAFTGFDHGGIVSSYSARGQSSFGASARAGFAAPAFAGGFHGGARGGFNAGGGGGFHGGGGGGFHGGGGGGGGGGHR
jgi:Protein of unknown function (DUF3300)